MSVQSEINRIRNAVADSYTAVDEKGGTLPSTENVANLAPAIRSIEAGLKPEIIVTAEAGSTLTCGSQTYTLGTSETTHTFVIELGTYIVTATKGSYTATETVLVDTVAQYSVELEYITDVTVTLTGSGSATYCYATISGSKRYGAGTYTVQPGDTITFGVYGRSSTYYGEVKINNSQMLKVTNQTTQTYAWTVPVGISGIAISFFYISFNTQRSGEITVTTS